MPNPLIINPVLDTAPSDSSAAPQASTAPLIINPTEDSTKLINGRQEDWLDRTLRADGGVNVGPTTYPDFRNLHIGWDKNAKFVDPTEDPDYEFRRRLSLGSLAGEGALATGAPLWAAGLTAATAKTPGDVAASTLTNFGIPLLSKLKTGSRVVNSMLGALKGWGLYKGAQAGQAAVDQQPQPGLLPTSASDLAGQGISALAGTTEGLNSVPAGLSKFQTKLQEWATHKGKIQQAEQDVTSSGRALEDAQAALTEHERTLKPQGAQELKDLSNQITDQKQKVADAAGAVDNHQQLINDRQKQQVIDAAESLQDQILEQQRKLRGLGNPDTAKDYLESGDLADALRSSLGQGDDATEEAIASRIRQAKIDTRNKIADLQVQQRRMNQGRFDNIATDEDLANWKQLANLKDAHLSQVQALSNLNQKYAQLTATQLAHAAAGGAPVADQAAIATHQKLVQGVQDAKLAKRAAEDKLTGFRNTAPDKPQGKETMDNVVSFLKHAILPIGTAGFISHAEGGTPALTTALMTAIGLGSKALQNSPKGQELINLVNQHIGQTATRAVPGISNQLGGQ